ncbi:hypothetical protein [Reyranella sp.]|uniref:hypothetical protein n=1 Tax=Reyranella sp. TaxID=1929291 RepID=UPI003D129DD2
MSDRGLIPRGPAIRWRADVARQPARYARIDAYLEARGERRRVAYEREQAENLREAERFVPCALCGGQTEVWNRLGLDPSIAICSKHMRRMPGNYPFGRASYNTALPESIERPMFVARVALYAVESMTSGRHHVEAA